VGRRDLLSQRQRLSDADVNLPRRIGGTVIQLEGERDVATANQLWRLVEALPPADCRWIHLDLADLVFIDAAGLTALIRADIVVKERSGRMTIGRPRPLARLLIGMTGLPTEVVDDGLEQSLGEQTG
jgi:anti-anti-sigma factor